MIQVTPDGTSEYSDLIFSFTVCVAVIDFKKMKYLIVEL